MESDLAGWVAVVFRFIHVIAAIMWIGNSLLFTWMELHLQKPRGGAGSDLLGTLDMLHGGGVYHMEKRLLRPGAIPSPLHWFMWQSYTTWITGFILILTMYHTGGGTFFLDATKTTLPGWIAVVASLGGLAGGWLVYDAIWRSPLGSRPALAVPVSLGLLFGAAFLFSLIFNGRAMYLQIGAMMGTMMSANVFFHIIRNQHRFMEALEAGRPHDVNLGKAAKARSLHNHYMTFPVVFLMLSAHFPQLYGAEWNVAILAVIVVALMCVKFLMNARYRLADASYVLGGVVLAAGAAVYVLLALPGVARAGSGDQMVVAGKRLFISKGCATCHMEGSADLAPQLAGIYGTTRVFVDGSGAVADEAYLREAIVHPHARIVSGYAATMPNYESVLTGGQVDQIVAYIRSMSAGR